MSFISVIMPTMRAGGLDIVCDGLKNQTFTDFELIIVDGIYKYRKEDIAEKAKNYKFKIKHIEPFNNPFPKNAFCRYANSGIAHADSEIVVFITDYTYLPPKCLYAHAMFNMHYPTYGLMCPHQYYELNNVNPVFESYREDIDLHDDAKLYHHSNSDTQKYANDIKDGKYNNLMWSILNKEFDYATYNFILDPVLGNADPKLEAKVGAIQQQFFHGKNESCKLSSALKINGWSELLDGGHGYQDTDFSDRLTRYGGVDAWCVEPKIIAKIINPRPIFPHGYRSRSVAENKTIWHEQCSKGYPITNKYKLSEINNLIKIKNQCDVALNGIKFE
jgi:glycosyltransferase involved in cell wall biosynthesis